MILFLFLRMCFAYRFRPFVMKLVKICKNDSFIPIVQNIR